MDRDTDPDVRLLRGVANPSRLAIIRLLGCEGSVAACDFRCCNVGQPTVSHHLKVLREAGWVRTERRGSGVYYSIEPGAAERFGAIAGELMPLPSGDSAALTPLPKWSDIPQGRIMTPGCSSSTGQVPPR